MINYELLEQETIKILTAHQRLRKDFFYEKQNIDIKNKAYELYIDSLTRKDLVALNRINKRIKRLEKLIIKNNESILGILRMEKNNLTTQRDILLSGYQEIKTNTLTRKEVLILANYLMRTKELDKEENNKEFVLTNKK